MLAQQVVALEGSNVDMKRQLEAQQRELQSEADELTRQVAELGGTNSELQRSLEAQQSELQVRIQRAQQDASQVCPLSHPVFPPHPPSHVAHFLQDSGTIGDSRFNVHGFRKDFLW